MKTCCLIGTKKIKTSYIELKIRTIETIVKAISESYTHFIVGAMPGFDIIAIESVLYLKRIYPQIKLEIVLPHKDYEIKQSNTHKKVYGNLIEKADKVTVLLKLFV